MARVLDEPGGAVMLFPLLGGRAPAVNKWLPFVAKLTNPPQFLSPARISFCPTHVKSHDEAFVNGKDVLYFAMVAYVVVVDLLFPMKNTVSLQTIHFE
jgi:hypothetical protein